MNLLLDSISYSINGTSILEDVSLELAGGEFVALIGPNGSGKSTTLNCAAGLFDVDRGTVRLGENDLSSMNRREIARTLAVIGQNVSVNFDFSVHEVVMMGRAPHKNWLDPDSDRDQKIVEEALRDVGMAERSERRFRTLSGGEQQRVLIARCLAQQANVLLLDEPTNHLDVRYTLDFLDLIHDVEGNVLIAMHDLNLASQYADRLMVLEDGRVRKTGEPTEVLTKSLISDVFGRSVTVETEPTTGRPHITFLPGEVKSRQ
jgi:iron complex transport system ATP-binding protein